MTRREVFERFEHFILNKNRVENFFENEPLTIDQALSALQRIEEEERLTEDELETFLSDFSYIGSYVKEPLLLSRLINKKGIQQLAQAILSAQRRKKLSV